MNSKGGKPEKTDKDLERLVAFVRENGADEAAIISAVDISVDERVRLKCQVPLCDTYGRNYTCPPHVPSPAEFKKALKNYKRGILVRVIDDLAEAEGDPFRSAGLLHEIINRGEKKAFSMGYRFAAGFIGGCCRLCEICGAVTGEACRFPFKARPSMESMGIDVIKTAEKAGMSVAFPVREKVSWIGLILVE